MGIIEWIREHTQGIIEAIRQILYLLLGFGWLRQASGEPWEDSQIALVMATVGALLGLFQAKTTVSAHKVQARVDEARAKGLVEGVRQAESGTGPWR